MGFRFSRRIKILPGIRLNISKSGVSTSVGTRGAWVTFGKRGTRTTVGLPGTGISYTTQQKSAPSEDGGTGASQGTAPGWVWLVGLLVVMGLLKACSGS